MALNSWMEERGSTCTSITQKQALSAEIFSLILFFASGCTLILLCPYRKKEARRSSKVIKTQITMQPFLLLYLGRQIKIVGRHLKSNTLEDIWIGGKMNTSICSWCVSHFFTRALLKMATHIINQHVRERVIASHKTIYFQCARNLYCCPRSPMP